MGWCKNICDEELVCQILQLNPIYFCSFFRVCSVRRIWKWHVAPYGITLHISYLSYCKKKKKPVVFDE